MPNLSRKHVTNMICLAWITSYMHQTTSDSQQTISNLENPLYKCVSKAKPTSEIKQTTYETKSISL